MLKTWRACNFFLLLTVSIFLSLGPSQKAQAAERSVSIEEFNQLKGEHEKLKKEFAELKAFIRKDRPSSFVTARRAPPPKGNYVTKKEFADFKKASKAILPGLTNALIAGYAFAGYTDAEGSDSNRQWVLRPSLPHQTAAPAPPKEPVSIDVVFAISSSRYSP